MSKEDKTVDTESTTEQTTAVTEEVQQETKSGEAEATAADDSTTTKADAIETKTDSSSDASSETTSETQETAETTDANESGSTESNARVVPEVDGYNLPEGTPQVVAEFAHENDMTQEQLDATLIKFGEFNQMAEQGRQLEMRKNGEKLIESWGAEKQYKLSIVQRALKQNDTDGSLSELLNVTGFGNHPAVLNFFLNVGNSMKEGGFLKGSVNTPKGKTTAASAMFGENHPSNSN